MRITFLLPQLDLGGGNRVVSIHAQGLADRGHEVIVVVPPPKPTRLISRIKSGKWWTEESPSIEGMKAESHFAHLSVEVRLARQPGIILAHDVPDADLVIATWWETAEWVLALPASKGVRISFVQGHEVFDYLPIERVRRTYTAPLHRIAVSSWLIRILAEQYSDRSVDLVPNAVDHNVFFATHRHKQVNPTIGFLYSTTPSKGVGVTLSVVRLLLADIPHLRLLCFGLDSFPKFPGVEAETEFSCRPPQSRIREIYSACDVWLTASTTEGFNLPAMEAMACGTPVVSTRTGWPEEAIRDGENGYLVEVGDVASLKDRATRVLSLSDSAWTAMSDRAKACASRYTWVESTQLFEKALLRALAESGANAN